MSHRTIVRAVTGLAIVLSLACQTSADPTPPIETTSSFNHVKPQEQPLIVGPLSPSGVHAIFATADLGTGSNRVGFLLVTKDGFVMVPNVKVTSHYNADDVTAGDLIETVTAVLRPWPYGHRGLYTTHIFFDKAGPWRLQIEFTGADISIEPVELFFNVKKSSASPAIGSRAPLSYTKTLSDVSSIEQLTTGSLRDPDLYQTSIAKAVTSSQATVIVFASPAFCTTAVCGPQVAVLQEIKNKYKGHANFIHVDFYDNPNEIHGDLSMSIISPSVAEWNLPSTEWTFVVDKKGNISAKFEGFATIEELETALLNVL